LFFHVNPPRDEKYILLPSLYFFIEKNENDFFFKEAVNNEEGQNEGIWRWLRGTIFGRIIKPLFR